MKNQINKMISNYVEGKWDYPKFSYYITPFLFKAIDEEIKDEELKTKLISIFNMIDIFLTDEFYLEYNLKRDLGYMINEK